MSKRQETGGGRGEGRGGGRGEGRGGGRGEGRGGGRGEGRGGGRGEGIGGGRGEGIGGGRGEEKGGGRGEGIGGGRGEGRGGGRGEGRGGGRGEEKGGGRGEGIGGGRGEGRGGGRGEGRGGGRGEGRGGGRGEGRGVGAGGSSPWGQMTAGGEEGGRRIWSQVAVGGGGVKGDTRSGSQEKKPDQPGSSGKSVTSGELGKRGPSKEVSLLHLVPERRNKQGVKGNKEDSPILVEANFFPITLKKTNITAYQYDVVVEPKLPKYMIRIAWNEFVKRNFPGKYPSFDGSKIAVSAKSLTDKPLSDTFEVNNPENNRIKEYTVEIKLTNVLNLENAFNFMQARSAHSVIPMAELAAIDIVLRNHAANILVRAGRSLFQRPMGNCFSLGEGMEMWQGYYQSAVLGWKIFLNFDVSHRGFPRSDILKTVQEICFTDFRGNSTPLTPNSVIDKPRDLMKLEKHLKSLKVEYEIPGCAGSKRVFKVNGVRKNPADCERFKLENNVETNVVKYFREVKNYQVKYPKLPCLWVGSTQNSIYVPMELCTIIPGQLRSGRLSEIQTSNMIKYAANPPPVRKAEIMEQFNKTSLSNEYINEFGLSVVGEFQKIQARILKAPQLESGRDIKVQSGRWDVNTFLDAKPLAKWCVLILDERFGTGVRDNFVREVIDQANRMGMRAESPIPHRIECEREVRPQFLRNSFTKLKQLGVALAFVIIPDRGDVYAKVKRASEIEVGVLTQCIRSSTLNKTFSPRGINRSTISNILLKVNAKLNGVNHSLHANSLPRCLRSPTMIVGADVTHPPPEALSVPSVAAVAASHDMRATQYNTIRRVQPSKLEVIQDLKEIIKDQLLYFYRKNRCKPVKIIVFRDGVSEGQVNIVLMEELRAIQQACISLQAGDNKMDYQPQITFLIVQKRHHTRFFPMPKSEYCNPRSPNVPPGTCVDTEIVHPRDLDFYLVSHMSRLGTARPTKYKLIYDDSDMTEDELEKLSYYLCHLVVRCSMSISYPAPTYYAHLAALRGRIHLSGIDLPTNGMAEGQKHIQVQNYFKEEAPMFFV